MSSHEGVLSFMDILDLDEEVIDSRLKSIMDRSTFTNQHLQNALHLLKYKELINLRDGSDCENEAEFNFIAKLIIDIQEENIDDICRIISIALKLDKSTIVCKAEHLIQQILSNIEFASQKLSGAPEGDSVDENSMQKLLNFKLCNSIMDAVIKYNEKLSLPILDVPLEKVLATSDDNLKNYFLSHSVPKLFKGLDGYNILDRIWNYIKQFEISNLNALKTLSCLAEYYLPVADKQGNINYESQIITQYEFWDILLCGLMSDDPATRKISVYLIKRSIDNIISLNKDIHISSRTEKIFTWQNKDKKMFKENWDNFFILIDSLEEKQSNIVLPSLQLFETIESIGHCWLSCAFNIGLKHDNAQVRFKCIEHRLKTRIKNITDAAVLLEALNDINFYDHPNDWNELRHKITGAFNDRISFVSIIKAVPKIKWSPIPLYHLSEILAEENVELSSIIDHTQLFQIIKDLLNIPCNNIPIRYAFKINITYFVGQCCKGFNWRNFIDIHSMVDWEKTSHDSIDKNPFIAAIKNFNLNLCEKQEFFDIICSSHATINLGLIYLENHSADLNIFLERIDNKIKKIQDICNRTYSNKSDCFNEIIFVTHLLNKTMNKTKDYSGFQNTIAAVLSREYKTITRYIFSLAQSGDANLSIEDMNILFKGYESMADIDDYEVRTLALDIYRKMTIILTNKDSDIAEKLLAISVVRVVTKKLYPSSKKKMFTLKQMLHIMKHMNVKETSNTIDVGRFRNAFYEKSCEILHRYMEIEEDESENVKSEDRDDKSDEIVENLKELVEFVQKVMDRGGYGCLKWVLKMMNAMLPEILKSECVKFNVSQFLERVWKEIEELKSNNQYSPCMQQFVRLITQDSLLKKAVYNNVIILYCSKIVDYGTLKNSPLLFLVYELNHKDISEDHGQIVHVLSDILLFSPVPKKDHRITDNVALEILQNPKYSLDQCTVDIYFNSDIQYTVIMTLSQIKHGEIFQTITSLIIHKIDEHFKTKQRYHGNSQSHRLLLIGLQHLLFMPLLNQKVLESENIFSWVTEQLGKLPHQPSVRICLEWFIALHFYVKNVKIDQKAIELMKAKNIPVISQFMILYWILKHKISLRSYNLEEFKFVMDFLLSHTMGQMFNLRLHAQYLATKLYQKLDMNLERYTYIIEVIRKTFVESAKDKNFVRLEEDFFIQEFDIVGHFTPVFIYYFLPRYCDIGINEKVDKKYLNGLFQCVNKTIANHGVNNAFHKEWLKLKKPDEEILFKYDFNKNKDNSDKLENSEAVGTIQKKYIPWKNMSDIVAFETENKKAAFVGDLILVASLIDKLPNLGGMARTSEVFGVNTYVVDSLRHLQDKVFQGLSVSAERWVNIEEVRPGPPLKDYLMKKKAEGYSVVAAEQTSTSVKLQKFKFPRKTLLLLGHEKGGIPCDLLPIMDYCVEIPQQGFVRSLNVHVTAAIFVWEYFRQNVFYLS